MHRLLDRTVSRARRAIHRLALLSGSVDRALGNEPRELRELVGDDVSADELRQLARVDALLRLASRSRSFDERT